MKHMLRSVGPDKAGKSIATARCRVVRPGRPFPEDFTGWESDVTCPDCRLP